MVGAYLCLKQKGYFVLAKLENFNTHQLADIVAQLPINSPYIIEPVNEGYSSTCFFIKTKEKLLCLRLYNLDDFPCLLQEVDALEFCSAKGLPVPRLLQWESGSVIYKFKNVLAICYICIEGRSVKQNELNPFIAAQAGKLLGNFLKCATSYNRDTTARDEVTFVHQCYEAQYEKVQACLDRPLIHKINDILGERRFDQNLQCLTKGLVHGDFYYGNVIIKDHHLCGIIDFGDSYLGAPFFDIVTGAMEFSCNNKQQIDFDCLQAFIMPLRDFLLKEHITAPVFYHAMLLMCLKFLLLTLGQHNENDYTKRMENLISGAVKGKIKHFF